MTGRSDSESQTPIPLSDYDYELPEELIAQEPIEPRDASRLLVVGRESGTLADRRFWELPELLEPGDLLVLNDTRVRHARLHGRRATGGAVELLVLHNRAGMEWHCLARPARRLKVGERVGLLDSEGNSAGVDVTLLEKREDTVVVSGIDEAIIERFGSVPLPPYIRSELGEPERYQTVYSRETGSAAAPTAGLHFTNEVFERCEARNIDITRVTLHVGLDTFRPIAEEDARQHRIHTEWCRVSPESLRRIYETRERGNRVLAVGTTVVRALESAARAKPGSDGYAGWTDLYVTPPFRFQLVSGLITNFHLPRSTLLLLVSAFAGRALMWRAYEHAIRERYRFYSFGDAMLIL